jgi:L-lactate dehydrogenase
VLDTARLRVSLAAELGLSPASVHASVVGEHGDSEVALWSTATAGGAAVSAWLSEAGRDQGFLADLLAGVRGAAGRIIEGKGATSTAIGFSAARIIEAIGRDERAVLNVSTEHIISGRPICLSLPTVVGSHGAGPVIDVKLNADETKALEASAQAIRTVIDAVTTSSTTAATTNR